MIGTKLAHYEITSHLGSGGMGDVYQATDSKLGRSVAIKFLPEAFSHDSERVARFEREARVLASLNHSNIAAIHGLEESGERKFLVMELVDGETLAERIKRGPIPVDESLNIAKSICEALEAANEKGVVHRDLKPANVKITPDGKVKVLDFGLAKAFENESANAALSNSPTLSMAATNAGVILGTAAYMSPEQAKGRPVDKRTDIFAFGCVLYEMLTGHAAFGGEDVPEILSRVLQREPDWTLLPANVPPTIQRLLRLCLQKDPKKRRQTATDVRIDIEQALAEPTAESAAGFARPTTLQWAPVVLALLAGAAITGLFAWLHARSFGVLQEPLRLAIPVVPGTPSAYDSNLGQPEISPDGKTIVYYAIRNGTIQLMLRGLDQNEATVIAGAEDAEFPFFSPDSKWVGFFVFTSRELKKVPISGGSPITISSVVGGNDFVGASWGADDRIVFVPSYQNGLWSRRLEIAEL